jgi:hypothetical protein
MAKPRILLTLLAAMGFPGATAGSATDEGQPVAGFRLQDHRGAWHALEDARDRRVVVIASPDTDFLAGYSPGMPPRVMPEGLAKLVPAGSRFLFQVHDTPRGTAQSDRSRVGLTLADPKSVRKRMLSVMAANLQFRIPPGVADFPSVASHRFGQDMLLYSLMPHMHLRGKSFRFEANYADGRREALLDVPRYDFDCQNVYVLTQPRPMPEGTLLRCLGRFDNSTGNPSNPDPKATVTWGEQTRDEMLVGYVEVALADQDLTLGLPAAGSLGDGHYDVIFRYRPVGRFPGRQLQRLEAGRPQDGRPRRFRLVLPAPQAEGRHSRVQVRAGRQELEAGPGQPTANGLRQKQRADAGRIPLTSLSSRSPRKDFGPDLRRQTRGQSRPPDRPEMRTNCRLLRRPHDSSLPPSTRKVRLGSGDSRIWSISRFNSCVPLRIASFRYWPSGPSRMAPSVTATLRTLCSGLRNSVPTSGSPIRGCAANPS